MWRFALLGLSAALLAGCGASDPIAAEEVSAAVSKTASEGTSRMEIVGDSEKEDVVMRGVADHERNRASFTYDVTSSDDETLSGAKLRVIGTKMYISAEMLGATDDPATTAKPKPWFETDLAETELTLDQLLFPFPFVDPGRILAGFQKVSGSVESLGEEAVRGVPANRYRLTLDLARMIETAPADDRAALRKELEERKTKTEPVEVWIDDAGLARRVRFTVDSDDVTIDFFDFGIDVDIEAPPADQVQPDDLFLEGEMESAGQDDVETDYEEAP